MERSTIEKRFGPVTEKQAQEVVLLHRALVCLSKRGVKVNVKELDRVIEVASSMNQVKNVRTLESVRNSLVEGVLHPVFDLFKDSGRSLVYQVFPNITDEIPQSVFLTPSNVTSVNLSKVNPLGSVAEAARLLEKGLVPTHMVGETLFLAPVSA